MITITREQAQKIIDAADEVITALAGTNEDVHPDNSTKVVRLYDDLNDHYAPPEVVRELARIALASLEADDSGRNPVLVYADSYRDMAKQGVESVTVWSVINDLERNIAPLFTAHPAPAVNAEPVAVVVDANEYGSDGNLTHQRDIDYFQEDIDSIPAGTKLYAAPPAPVVPMEITEDEQEDAASEGWADSFRGGWNACRACMLEGDKS